MPTKKALTDRERQTTLADLADLPIWAARGKTKDARRAPINPHTGGNASNTKPETWGTRKAAERRARKLRHNPGVGIMLGPECAPEGLVRGALDLDGCYEPLLGQDLPEPWVGPILDRFPTYCEVSPSGTGLRVLFHATAEDIEALREDDLIKCARVFSRGEHNEIKIAVGHQYVSITGHDFGPDLDLMRPSPVRVVGVEALRWLIEDYGPSWVAQGRSEADQAAPAGDSGWTDDSGSGQAWRFAIQACRDGLAEDAVRAAIEADDGPAGEWWGRAPERERDRTIKRAFARVEADGSAPVKADEFEDMPALVDTDRAYQPDQNGAIEAFADCYGHALRFDHGRGQWQRFTRHTWRPEQTKLAREYARRVCMVLAREAVKPGKGLRHVGVWEAVERGAQADRTFATEPTAWDRDPWLLGTPGGVVDLRTGVLRDGRPEDMISKRTAVAPVPLDAFDPEHDCPQWLAFLDFALSGDADAIRFVQTWFGLSLTGDVSEQRLLFIHGGGGNGKGLLTNTLAWLAGDYAEDVPSAALTARKHEAHPTELARLQGVRLALASEIEPGARWAESRIKSLTGGDPITARFMRGDFFTFDPQLSLTVVGNNRPSFTNVDDAIRRRFLLLEMNRKPRRRDPQLPEKLRSEGPGILSWAIQGAVDWRRNGLVIPASVQTATEGYFESEDVFSQWISEKCETGDRYSATTDSLWDSWTDFAWDNGADPGSKKRTFPDEMKRRGFSAAKVRSARGWKGIKPRSEE